MPYQPGRHFLQIPGPTNVPDRILRAIDRPTIDHRSVEFAGLGTACLECMKAIFKTRSEVVIYPSSGTGAWEAALVNTLSQADRVVIFESGQFASLWSKMATNLTLRVDVIPGDWRRGADLNVLRAKLEADGQHEIKAVMVVHNETSTGVKSDITAIRKRQWTRPSIRHCCWSIPFLRWLAWTTATTNGVST